MITGHTHRGGPDAEEAEWPLPGGGQPPQHRQLGLRLRLPPPRHARPAPTGPGPSPGSRTSGPPRRVQLLLDHAPRAGAKAPRRRDGREPLGRSALSDRSHSAMIAPISGPASSCRKCEAFSIGRGGGKLSSLETRSPTENGSTGSESAQSTSVGRSSSRSASATAFALGGAGRVGLGRQDQREGAGAGLRRRRLDRAPRRRRSPRRPGRSCSRLGPGSRPARPRCRGRSRGSRTRRRSSAGGR